MKLYISKRDAAVLRAVCRRIGGDPAGPRGAMDRLDAQLAERRIEPLSYESIYPEARAIHFRDGWPESPAAAPGDSITETLTEQNVKTGRWLH